MENPYVHELRAELNLLLKKQAQFWNLEALGRQRIPNSSNTRSGKRSFTNYATNLPTPLPSSGLESCRHRDNDPDVDSGPPV